MQLVHSKDENGLQSEKIGQVSQVLACSLWKKPLKYFLLGAPRAIFFISEQVPCQIFCILLQNREITMTVPL